MLEVIGARKLVDPSIPRNNTCYPVTYAHPQGSVPKDPNKRTLKVLLALKSLSYHYSLGQYLSTNCRGIDRSRVSRERPNFSAVILLILVDESREIPPNLYWIFVI